MAHRSPSKSPLLDKLPPELRNRIWALSLTTDGPLDISSNDIETKTALLRTCTQIQNEASPMFFAKNSFTIVFTAGAGNSIYWECAMGWLQTIDESFTKIMKTQVEIVIPVAVRMEIDGMKRQEEFWKQEDCQAVFRKDLKEPLKSFVNALGQSGIELMLVTVADAPPFPTIEPGQNIDSDRDFWRLKISMRNECERLLRLRPWAKH